MNAIKSVLITVGQIALTLRLYHWVVVQRRGHPPFLGMAAVYLVPPIVALLANALVVVHLSRTGRSAQVLRVGIAAVCLTLVGFWVGLGLSMIRWGE